MMHNLFHLKRKYPPFSRLLNYGYEFGSAATGPSSVNLLSPFPENDVIYLIAIIIFATAEEVNEQIYVYPEGNCIIQWLLCHRILVVLILNWS